MPKLLKLIIPAKSVILKTIKFCIRYHALLLMTIETVRYICIHDIGLKFHCFHGYSCFHENYLTKKIF